MAPKTRKHLCTPIFKPSNHIVILNLEFQDTKDVNLYEETNCDIDFIAYLKNRKDVENI